MKSRKFIIRETALLALGQLLCIAAMIGVFALLVTARLNNIPLSVTDSDLITLGLKTAAGEWKYSDILHWVRSNQVGQ